MGSRSEETAPEALEEEIRRRVREHDQDRGRKHGHALDEAA